MTALARLGLGTVQFGLDYGVSNRGGRPSERETAAILARAAAAGVGFIDTAPAYGEAEALIGRHLPAGHGLRIITKTPALTDDAIDARHGRQVLDGLAASLDRLKVNSVHAFLVHQSSDLAKTGWQHLVDAMLEARSRGWTSRIGASVYDADQLALVESRFQPQLVQLPLNVLDRRPIAAGTLARLKAAGVEIHVRSVFLQGLLLMEPDALPEFFAPLRPTIVRLRETWQRRRLSALGGCLAFALRQPQIDAVIVGVNRMTEFAQIEAQIEAIVSSLTDDDADIALNPPIDAAFLDPSRWPDFVH
jgi:aryl-alcohol dehydrogenase-like predicted oxidoreductase